MLFAKGINTQKFYSKKNNYLKTFIYLPTIIKAYTFTSKTKISFDKQSAYRIINLIYDNEKTKFKFLANF